MVEILVLMSVSDIHGPQSNDKNQTTYNTHCKRYFAMDILNTIQIPALDIHVVLVHKNKHTILK